MKRLLANSVRLIVIALGLLVMPSFAQIADCPPTLICLTQQQANIAAQNARELQATREKVTVLEQALVEKDKSIAELKQLNEKNVADLKQALRQTEIALAEKTGQLIARESEVVRQSAIITAMIPMLRKKRIALINIF